MSLVAADKARLTPDALALADERHTLSWSQLDPILNRAANALLTRSGLTRIAVYAPNSVETVIKSCRQRGSYAKKKKVLSRPS